MIRALLVVALAAAACEKSSTTNLVDAGPDLEPDGPRPDRNPDSYSPKWPGTCDPTDQNCPPEQECIIDCATAAEFVCRPSTAGTAKSGEPCQVGTCERGSTCVQVAAGMNVCRKWCKADEDCPPNKRCTIFGVACSPDAGTQGWLCGY